MDFFRIGHIDVLLEADDANPMHVGSEGKPVGILHARFTLEKGKFEL